MPEGEARRIYALAATYSKTALATGMEDKSKPMHELSRLDYDKAKPPRVISPQAQVSANARAAAQGRQVMAELVRRQKLAQQLLNR